MLEEEQESEPEDQEETQNNKEPETKRVRLYNKLNCNKNTQYMF